ncbi:MAG: hypothetical protein Q8L10_04870 [Candidatus Moranbacteria bacterium]|nr:hypothetical protein [Candidatus Moranbacteria bacterium]
MTKRSFVPVGMAAFVLACLIGVSNVSARIEKIEMAVEDDFQVNPAQIRIEAYPGDVARQEVWVDNRLGEKQEFLVAVENPQGLAGDLVQDGGQQSGVRMEYSAKDWIKSELSRFIITQGERQFFDIEIAVPSGAEAGEYYARIFVAALPEGSVSELDNRIPANMKIMDRVGVDVVVDVKGFAKKEGALVSFEVGRPWYQNLDVNSWRVDYPVSFLVNFRNSGVERLRPYGSIEIRNALGWKVGDIPVEPFNVLRDSARGMVYNWERDWFLGGYYTATLRLQRGDDRQGSDTATVSFWVAPWKEVLLAGILVILYKRRSLFSKNKKADIEMRQGRISYEKSVKPKKKTYFDIRVTIHKPSHTAENKTK